MEIPPKGWGAVESLIWEYAEALRGFGHEVDIINVPDRNEIVKLENSKQYDVSHVHYDVFYDVLPYLNAKKVLISSHYPYIDQKHKHAQDHAGENIGLQHLMAKSTSRVLRVKNAQNSDACCMEVPRLNAFAIGNGVIVHNCATRYALMMLRFSKTTQPKHKPEPQQRPLDETFGY